MGAKLALSPERFYTFTIRLLAKPNQWSVNASLGSESNLSGLSGFAVIHTECSLPLGGEDKPDQSKLILLLPDHREVQPNGLLLELLFST